MSWSWQCCCLQPRFSTVAVGGRYGPIFDIPFNDWPYGNPVTFGPITFIGNDANGFAVYTTPALPKRIYALYWYSDSSDIEGAGSVTDMKIQTATAANVSDLSMPASVIATLFDMRLSNYDPPAGSPPPNIYTPWPKGADFALDTRLYVGLWRLILRIKHPQGAGTWIEIGEQ